MYYREDMRKAADDQAVQTAHEGLVEASTALGLAPDDVTQHIRDLLDLTRDVAHNRSRPAAPLTSFLVGLAAQSPQDVEENITKLSALVNKDAPNKDALSNKEKES